MQACQVCGAAEVDANGWCTGCGQYRGFQSYAVAGPAPYGEPVYEAAVGSYPVSPGVPVSPGASGYPVSPGAPPFATAVAEAAPAVTPAGAEPARRSPLATPLFLLTVMVVVLVAGTVSVVLIQTSDRGRASGSGSGRTSAGPVATPSASPSASTVVDRCVVGDWAVTSASVKNDDLDLSTTAGGIFHLRAEGAGTWDFGSGITLTGTIEDLKSQSLITGRVDFTFRTVGQSFTFQDVRNDVREVFTQGRKDPVNQKAEFALSVAEYTCGGNAMRMKFGPYDLQMGRK
jgi:hypothetical protein